MLNYRLPGGQELPFYYGQVPPFFPPHTKIVEKKGNRTGNALFIQRK